MTRALNELPNDVVDVELSAPLPTIGPRVEQSKVRMLARVHSHPVGLVDVELPPDSIAPRDLATALAETLPLVREHLRTDGLSVPQRLGVAGFGERGEPSCVARRRELLTDAPPISVLVATRDRTESLLRCLASMARLEYPKLDVVVVDSAPSTDETADAVAALGGWLGSVPVRYVCEPREGVARARNRGLQKISGSWVAITDDDVTVDPHWLTGVAEAARSTVDVGCVTGPTLAAEVSTPAARFRERQGGFPNGFARQVRDLGRHRPSGEPLFPYTVGRLGAGANMAFDVAVLGRIGGFDPAMGAGTPARGGEDLLALLQVLTAGYTLVYEPAALNWHWHRSDYGDLRQQLRDSGIGLGAYLSSAVLHEPSLLFGMLRNAVPAVRHLLSRSSPKNRNKGSGFPRELEAAELLGVLQGPFRYGQSRWQDHRGR